MKFSKRLATALAAMSLAVVSLSVPAHAAPISLTCTSVSTESASGNSITINLGPGCFSVAWTKSGGSVNTVWTGKTASMPPSNGTFFGINQLGDCSTPGCTQLVLTYAGATGMPNATGSITFRDGFSANDQTVTFTLSANSGGGGSSSGSATVAPTETLSLAVSASGASCTGGNPSGVSGSWLTLPSADQCSQSGPTAKAGATLLGWSTNANFPIARAQSQIDKRWGVIDEEIGGIRMIFIPAGMAVFVSGSNNLYPIWSK
jgi:hypothetical protein